MAVNIPTKWPTPPCPTSPPLAPPASPSSTSPPCLPECPISTLPALLSIIPRFPVPLPPLFFHIPAGHLLSNAPVFPPEILITFVNITFLAPQLQHGGHQCDQRRKPGSVPQGRQGLGGSRPPAKPEEGNRAPRSQICQPQ